MARSFVYGLSTTYPAFRFKKTIPRLTYLPLPFFIPPPTLLFLISQYSYIKTYFLPPNFPSRMAHPQQTSHPKLEATSSSTLQGDHGQSHSPVGPPLRKSSASRSEEDMDVDEDQEGEGMLDVKYDGDDNGGDEGLREGNVGTEGDDDPGDEEVRSGGGFERRSEARSSSSPSPSASQASKTRTKTPTSAEKQRRRRPKASKLIGTPHSQHETEERPRKSPHSPSSSISTNRNENDTSADDVAPETAAAAVGGNEDQDDAAAVGDDDRENESAMDWDDLEQRFEEKMGECREKEEGIRRELEKWIQVSWNIPFVHARMLLIPLPCE